ALAGLVEDYLADTEAYGLQSSRLAFAHRRRDVFALNQAIRRALRSAQDASADILLKTETGPRAFAAGDRIVFTRNDRQIGVKNGSLGTVEAVDEQHLTVRLDDEERRIVF